MDFINVKDDTLVYIDNQSGKSGWTLTNKLHLKHYYLISPVGILNRMSFRINPIY